MGDENLKNIGIIGLGKMGLSHLAIANSTCGLRVTGICDPNWAVMSALQRNTGIKAFRRYRKMLDKMQLDGVIIATPNTMHYSIAAECIERGIGVFIEKPLTLNIKESTSLTSLAESLDVHGQVGYVNRFNPMFAHARRLIVDGIIGDVRTYESKMYGPVITEPGNRGWRNDYKRGGGCLYDYGPHCIDLIHYIVGGGVVVATASLEKVYSSQVDDVVHATTEHGGQIKGQIHIDWSDAGHRKAYNSIEVRGTAGTLFVDKQELILTRDETSEDGRYQAGPNNIYITDLDTNVDYYLRGEDFSRQMTHFSDLLNGNTLDNLCSLSEATETDRVIQAIFDAARDVG